MLFDIIIMIIGLMMNYEFVDIISASASPNMRHGQDMKT